MVPASAVLTQKSASSHTTAPPSFPSLQNQYDSTLDPASVAFAVPLCTGSTAAPTASAALTVPGAEGSRSDQPEPLLQASWPGTDVPASANAAVPEGQSAAESWATGQPEPGLRKVLGATVDADGEPLNDKSGTTPAPMLAGMILLPAQVQPEPEAPQAPPRIGSMRRNAVPPGHDRPDAAQDGIQNGLQPTGALMLATGLPAADRPASPDIASVTSDIRSSSPVSVPPHKLASSPADPGPPQAPPSPSFQAGDHRGAADRAEPATLADPVSSGPAPGSFLLPQTQANPPTPRDPPVTAAHGESSSRPRVEPSEQLAPAIVSLGHAADGARRMTLRLDPAELGLVEIRIDRPAEAPPRVEIRVERPETLALLLRDQARLEHTLNQAGLPPDGRSLSIHLAPVSPPAPSADSSGPGLQFGSTGGSSGFAGSGESPDGTPRQGRGTPFGQGTSADAEAANPSQRWFRTGLDITA
jgi:hypothetical protein